MSSTKDLLRKAIEERAKLLGLSPEPFLNLEYSGLNVGIWKPKNRKTKPGLKLTAMKRGKRIGLKLTTREELFQPMRELVKLYKVYKCLNEDWKDVKDILRKLKKEQIENENHSQ